MAEVGSLGAVVFSVSEALVRTFADYSRKASARTATHDIIAGKPILEFLGPGAETISFKIKLSAFRGVNPKDETDKLRLMCQEGEAVRFILAGSPVSDNKWLIESVDEAGNFYDARGNLISSDVSISLKEYVERRNDNGSA